MIYVTLVVEQLANLPQQKAPRFAPLDDQILLVAREAEDSKEASISLEIHPVCDGQAEPNTYRTSSVVFQIAKLGHGMSSGVDYDGIRWT